jgi:hypothetical protein
MNKPNTEYALVRGPRTVIEDNRVRLNVQIVRSEEFDFAGYSFLRMSPLSDVQMEEWVANEDIHHYGNIA